MDAIDKDVVEESTVRHASFIDKKKYLIDIFGKSVRRYVHC